MPYSPKLAMRAEQVLAKIKLAGEEYPALFDSGVARSVMPKSIAVKLGRFVEAPEEEKYELETAKKGVKVRIIGNCIVPVEVAGCKIPRTMFEVSEDVDTIIVGRHELDSWDIIFTPEGPKPRTCPIRWELI